MIIDGDDAPPPPLHDTEMMRRPTLQAGPQYRPESSLRRSYETGPDYAEEELARMTRALESFSNRLEAAEHRSTLAISGIDQSVMGVLSRLDGIEREQGAVGARFEGGIDEVRATHAKLSERIRRMEQDEGPRAEAMKALEAALGKVAAQIYEGESRARGSLAEIRQDVSGIVRRVDRLDADVAAKADADAPNARIDGVVARVNERLDHAEGRTSAAIQALEASFANLDARLKFAENRLTPETEADTPEHRFQRLATELSEKVEASRAEIADHMRAAADGKLDRMEAALRDLAGHVEAAEKQSAQAIDRMGREVMRIAQSLGQRVATVETRSAQAVEQVGGEMARIADAMETRMRSADTAQAAALEKLGGEIGKIAERLAERIAASERRAATAIDEVGDQVARVTDKINQRYDRTAGELSERIRQSEERTAKLLEEARDSLDRRMAEVKRPSVFEPAPATEALAEAEVETLGPDPFAATHLAGAPALDDLDDDPFEPEPFAEAAAPPPPRATQAPAFEDEPFEPLEAEMFEEAAEAPPQQVAFTDFDERDEEPVVEAVPAPEPEDFFEPLPEEHRAEHEDQYEPAPLPVSPRSSTRELIEAARAAARQASAQEGRGRRRPIDEMFQAAIPAKAAEPQPAPKGLGAFLSRKKKKKDGATTLRTVLLASGIAAAVTASLVGANLMGSKSAERAKIAEADVAPAVPSLTAETPTTSDADLLAAALAPEPLTAPPAPVAETPAGPIAAPPASAKKLPPIGKGAPATLPVTATAKPAEAAPAIDPKLAYSAAVREIASGDPNGVESLRQTANLGYGPAQFYLAKLYESGSSGVKKDLAEARRWTERAAAGGDAKAMHNLGLYYFEGTGGAKNAATAAAWFLRAANTGLQDSQYNLARLYEQGYGVAPNPSEAYKWYLVAAAGGDSEAKSSAERLRQQLSPDVREAVQRTAMAFRPQAAVLAAK
jgi:localization factor PodJL